MFHPSLIDRHGIPDPGLLQGMCPLDERVPPQYPTTHRGRNRNQSSHWQLFNGFGDDDQRKHPKIHPCQGGGQVALGATFYH